MTRAISEICDFLINVGTFPKFLLFFEHSEKFGWAQENSGEARLVIYGVFLPFPHICYNFFGILTPDVESIKEYSRIIPGILP